jgi:hypothetical protein
MTKDSSETAPARPRSRTSGEVAEAAAKSGEDPFGNEPSESISKKALDTVLVGDDTEASAVVHSAIEDFAQERAHVTRRFLKTKTWDKTERITVGGGFRATRLGELAIARTEIILKAEGFKIEMEPIRHHPDNAGLTAHSTSLRPGSSKATIRLSLSTLAGPTSAAASWRAPQEVSGSVEGGRLEV